MKLALLLLLSVGTAQSQTEDDGLRIALSARPKVKINVFFIAAPISGRVSTEQIAGDTELLLRQSNVPVATTEADGILMISVRATRLSLAGEATDYYALLPIVEYDEQVATRAPIIACALANTGSDSVYKCIREHTLMTGLWRRDGIVIAAGADLRETVRKTIRDKVQEFVLEYLRASATPKP